MHALERIHERHGINQDQVLDMVRERARERGCTLREAFGVSRRTVSRALTILQRAGKVTIMASRGAYVA